MERLFQSLQTSQSERFPNIQATSSSAHFHFIPPRLSLRPREKKIIIPFLAEWSSHGSKRKKKEYILNGAGWAVNVIRDHGYLR